MEQETKADIEARYRSAETIADLFEVVKEAVREMLNKERAGLMLGLADLGASSGYWIGAYWMVGSNAIIMNSIPLKRIEETEPLLRKPYVFHVLLHEYLHSIGVLDEERTRLLTEAISREIFGPDHLITRMAQNISGFLPYLTYAGVDWQPDPRRFQVTLVEGFDKDNMRYIG